MSTRTTIDMPELDDPHCLNELSRFNQDKDQLAEALIRCSFITWDDTTEVYCVYVRDSTSGIIRCKIAEIEDVKNKDDARAIYKVLLNYYGIPKDRVRTLVQEITMNNTIPDPMCIIGDGKHLISWRGSTPYIDMYSDGLFRYKPREFRKRPLVSVKSAKHQGMIRYLMRMAGVEPPKGIISFTKAGKAKLKSIFEYHVFEFDMKVDAAKLAQPHLPMKIIRVLVGGSGLGKTFRVSLLGELFKNYAYGSNSAASKHFNDDKHPYITVNIDEATTMRLSTQKKLEYHVSETKQRIERKFKDVVTWRNPTFYLMTANSIVGEKNFKLTGPNQRWFLRRPIGNAEDFAKDVGWGIVQPWQENEKDGDIAGQWSKVAHEIYQDILAYFYEPKFMPTPSVEASKMYSNAVAYEDHMDDGHSKGRLNEEIILKALQVPNIVELLKAFQVDRMVQENFSTSEFKKAFNIKIADSILGTFLARFRINTGLDIANTDHNTNSYHITNWDLFSLAMRGPSQNHLGA